MIQQEITSCVVINERMEVKVLIVTFRSIGGNLVEQYMRIDRILFWGKRGKNRLGMQSMQLS